MRISLNRQVSAVRHRVLATVDIEEHRQEVQQLLKQVERDAASLPARAISFLQKEELIGSDRLLTRKGESVQKNGRLFARERGIFDVWYLNDDEYLETRPLLLQRVMEPIKGGYRKRAAFYDWPEAINESGECVLHCDSAYALVSSDNTTEKRQIRNLRINTRNGGLVAKEVELDLLLEVARSEDNKLNVVFTLKGSLPLEVNERKTQAEVELNYGVEKADPDFMDHIADFLGFEWSWNDHRMKCGVPDNNDSIFAFMEPLYNIKPSEWMETCYGTFAGGEIRKLPLMPADRALATEWQKKWLAELLREKYLSPEEIKYRQQVWLEHPAIQGYGIQARNGSELMAVLDRQQHPQSYWHAAAAHCLIPENSRVLPASLTLRKGNYLFASELLRELVPHEPIKGIIYSDRHYKTEQHAINMQKLADLAGVCDGIIFTENKDIAAPTGWCIQPPGKQRLDHDRYWIFLTKNKPVLWKCTNSLDFVDFRQEEPRLKASPSFVKIELKDLPDYLQQALNKQVDAEKEFVEIAQ